MKPILPAMCQPFFESKFQSGPILSGPSVGVGQIGVGTNFKSKTNKHMCDQMDNKYRNKSG